jgi:hypothetical protein
MNYDIYFLDLIFDSFIYCNIGTCDLLDPVSFAAPGLAP